MSKKYSHTLKVMVETYYDLPLAEVLRQSIERHCEERIQQDLLRAIANDFAPAVGRTMDYVTIRRWCMAEGVDITQTQALARRELAERAV